MTADHPLVDEVRGAGLYIGVDIVTDPESRNPDQGTALEIIEKLRERRVLTSVCGAGGNVLKLRPPLAFTDADLATFFTAFDEVLATLRT
jgi:4-aminobutyrate aminotransferase-like enzyme